MKKSEWNRFKSFAEQFVHVYWQTVRERKFPWPPDEPVEESLKDLLANISWKLEPVTDSNPPYHLLMESKFGDWWLFGFQSKGGGWELVTCSAKSDDPHQPHDLLGPVYRGDFYPFLRHVTANALQQVSQVRRGRSGCA